MRRVWLLGVLGGPALAIAQEEVQPEPPPLDVPVEQEATVGEGETPTSEEVADPNDDAAPDGPIDAPIEAGAPDAEEAVSMESPVDMGAAEALPAQPRQFHTLLDVAPGVKKRPSGLRGFLGLEIRPFSRADLVWVDEERTSGLAVGEFDGTLRPTLAGFGGVWFNKYVGLSANLGLAWLSADTQVNDLPRRRLWAVVRPGLDLRIGWTAPQLHRPVPWMYLGAYGNVPAVRDADEGRNEVEQEAADEAARIEQFRLGGIGVRGGVGVDYELLPGLSLGALIGVAAHRSLYIGGDQGQVSWWVQTDASLLLTFSWGREHADR